MSDDHFTRAHELASAYLDGELSTAERAEVEASPELLTLVGSFQGARETIAQVPTASPEARESAIAAALAEYDRILATPAAPAAQAARAPVVAMAGYRRWRRVLSMAAAVVAVGTVGIVVGKGLSKHSGTATTGSKSAPEVTSGAAPAAGGGAPSSTIGAINGPASAIPNLTDSHQLLYVQPQVGVAGVPAPQVATAGSTVGGADTGQTAPGQRSFVGPQIEAAMACKLGQHEERVAQITWNGTPALVVRDTVTGAVRAINGDCVELAHTAP
jgi:negative regulator of sigma E activity